MNPNPEKLKENPEGFIQRNGRRLIAILFWGSLVLAYWIFARNNQGELNTALYDVAQFLSFSIWGPAIYIGLYIIRPLIFFPATLITLIGGFIFGPLWGILYAIIGSNASAMLAYVVGRYFGAGLLDSEKGKGLLNKYAARMKENSFESVLIMRLLFLPYDLVHYVAGFLGINWRAFITATAIGALPGTISFVLFGASFGMLMEVLNGQFEVKPITIIFSVALIVGSIFLSRLIKRQQSEPATSLVN